MHADAPLDAALMVSMGRQRLIASVLMPSLESAGNGHNRTIRQDLGFATMGRMFDDFSAGVFKHELEIGLRRIIVFMLMLVASLANASVPLEATLEEMAQRADHILTGRVVGVDMVDARGTKITDREARTGPGLTNTIRLTVVVNKDVAFCHAAFRNSSG